jgi:hypothetical protein
LEPSFSGCDDIIWVFLPGEGFCMLFIVFLEIAVDGHLQIDDRVKDASFQASFCQGCEKAFNGVEPA